MDSRIFEDLARGVLSKYFQADLQPRIVKGVNKRFDFVSPDFKIIGDAKYFALVRGTRLPPAKFSVIAEYVWLLEKTSAEIKFLAFGNDRRVAEWWIKKYGDLLNGIHFFYIDNSGAIFNLLEN